MTSRPLLSSRRRRGLTFMEVMLASIISSMVAGGILATFYYGMRAQVTYADANQIRTTSNSIISLMAQDIRNTTAGGYNAANWPKLTANPDTAPVVTLTLFDSITGERIIWTYTRATALLSRSVENTVTGAAPVVQNYNIRFRNFRLAEISRQEWIGDTTTLAPPNITAIRILARVSPTLTAPGSVWTERDANGDGDTLDDEVAAGLFGGTNAGDQSGWYFIFNTEAAFRNT